MGMICSLTTPDHSMVAVFPRKHGGKTAEELKAEGK